MTTVRKSFIVASGALLALGLMTHRVRADYFSSDTRLPSPTYRSTAPVIYETAGGQYRINSFFDVFADFVRVPPPAPGTSEVHSFFDVFTELSFEVPGSPVAIRESPTKQTLRLNGLPPGEPVLMEILEDLDLSSVLPPNVLIRESPTLASTGQTTYTPLGNGVYRIDSFFDVFTELSLDGGQSWTPGSPLHLEGGVPEPSTLILVGLGLFGCTATTLRRARRGR